jgi:hypothetical protein
MKLYTFKKTSWHVRFYKWMFGSNPTHTYKTMCPYFWTYVVVFLTLPLILLVKLSGKAGTRFLNWTKDYKRNRIKRTIDHLAKICGDPNLTPEGAHKIRNSKCWKTHYWDISSELEDRVRDLDLEYRKYLIRLNNQKARDAHEKRENLQKRYDEYKEAKWFTPVSYIISFGIIGFVVFLIGYAGYNAVKMIDWPVVGKWTLYVLAAIISLGAIVGSIYALVKYVFAPFVQWLSCIKLPSCGICENLKVFFRLFKYAWMPVKYVLLGIVKLFAIIGGMIYSTYKKQCPMITWED